MVGPAEVRDLSSASGQPGEPHRAEHRLRPGTAEGHPVMAGNPAELVGQLVSPGNLIADGIAAVQLPSHGLGDEFRIVPEEMDPEPHTVIRVRGADRVPYLCTR